MGRSIWQYGCGLVECLSGEIPEISSLAHKHTFVVGSLKVKCVISASNRNIKIRIASCFTLLRQNRHFMPKLFSNAFNVEYFNINVAVQFGDATFIKTRMFCAAASALQCG